MLLFEHFLFATEVGKYIYYFGQHFHQIGVTRVIEKSNKYFCLV